MIESRSWIDFMWHMPPDATPVEHSARLQPSINLHAPVTAFMFSCSGTQCTTYPREMKARVSPVQWSEPHSILPPIRIRTRAAGFRIISGDHYTTTAHSVNTPWEIQSCRLQFPLKIYTMYISLQNCFFPANGGTTCFNAPVWQSC